MLKNKVLVDKVMETMLHQAEIPTIVFSLLGAGAPLDEDDINGRKAYYAYLEKKYNSNVNEGAEHHVPTTDL